MNGRTARALLLVAVAMVLVATTIGCAPTLPAETPGITGTVTSLVPGDDRPASLLVEGPAQPAGAVSDKAQVTVAPSTQIFGPDGAEAAASTIVQGASVKVWFEGPVAESYPVQGTAKAIQVLETPAPAATP